MSKIDDAVNNLKQEVDKIKEIAVKVEKKFLTEDRKKELTPKEIFKENPNFAALIYYHPDSHEDIYKPGDITPGLPEGTYSINAEDFLVWEKEGLQPNKRNYTNWVDVTFIKKTAKGFLLLKDEVDELKIKNEQLTEQLENKTQQFNNEIEGREQDKTDYENNKQKYKQDIVILKKMSVKKRLNFQKNIYPLY